MTEVDETKPPGRGGWTSGGIAMLFVFHWARSLVESASLIPICIHNRRSYYMTHVSVNPHVNTSQLPKCVKLIPDMATDLRLVEVSHPTPFVKPFQILTA